MSQLTLDDELAAKEKAFGLDLVEIHNAPFVATMRTVAVKLALAYGSVSCDDLRVLADKWGLKPAHPNAWGCVLRGPNWRVIDRRPSVIVTNHHREIKVFAYVGN